MVSYSTKQGQILVTKSSNERLESAIERTFPDLYSMIVTDKSGGLLSYFVSDECSQNCNLTKLKEVAKAVSIRFNIGNFQNLAGGHLEVTVNVFDEYFMLVRSFGEDRILAIMVPKTIGNLENTVNAVRSIDESQFGKNQNVINSEIQYKSEQLKKIPSTITEFQKNIQNYYDNLDARKYILVAEPYLDSPTEKKSEDHINIDLQNGESEAIKTIHDIFQTKEKDLKKLDEGMLVQ